MYVIPTSKPGQFRTGPVPGLVPVEADPSVVSSVPVKILQNFGTVERTAFGRVGARLEPAAP